MDIIVTITDEKARILESVLGVGQIRHWLSHALSNKCRQRIDAYITQFTNLNPKKVTEQDKLIELKGINLPIREV